MRIKDYPKTNDLKKDDVSLIDGVRGTKTITPDDLYRAILDNGPLEAKNGYFSGRDLGKLTPEMMSEIENGTFKGMFLGDYFTDGSGQTWIIMHFNYEYFIEQGGYRGAHAMVIPKKAYPAMKCNDGNFNDGIWSAKIVKEYREKFDNDARNTFGDALLPRYIETLTKIEDSKMTWESKRVYGYMMSSIEIRGSSPDRTHTEDYYREGHYSTQLAAFRHAHPGYFINPELTRLLLNDTPVRKEHFMALEGREPFTGKMVYGISHSYWNHGARYIPLFKIGKV